MYWVDFFVSELVWFAFVSGLIGFAVGAACGAAAVWYWLTFMAVPVA